MNTHRYLRDKENQRKWTSIHSFAENLCWDMLSQQDETIVWKKTSKKKCYSSRYAVYIHVLCNSVSTQPMNSPDLSQNTTHSFYRKSGPAVCDRSRDIESPYYQPLNPCIGGTRSQRWIPIEYRTPWPYQTKLNFTELDRHGMIYYFEKEKRNVTILHVYMRLLNDITPVIKFKPSFISA